MFLKKNNEKCIFNFQIIIKQNDKIDYRLYFNIIHILKAEKLNVPVPVADLVCGS